MRAFLSSLFAVLLLASLSAQAQQLPPAPSIAARAWILVEFGSGQVLTAEKADERVEPASLTKLMTAYLTFAALRQKVLAIEQNLPVSEKAWQAPGSRMFIDPKHPVAVGDLIKGMIVQSGNDACVALAEAIAGSEEGFVQMMNREAQRLGMKNTHFMNATGLPDPQHYSTARDLSLLASAIVRDFPDFYPTYSIKEFRYNKINQPNRNRLLWADPSVDGMKTGHTDNAGYCLIASAKRGQRRLLSVVLGTSSDNVRAEESLKLLNFGYQYYDAVRLYEKNQVVSQLKVWKGESKTVKAGFLNDFVLAMPKGLADRVQAQLVPNKTLLAPIAVGQNIGIMKLSLDGKPYGEYPVMALEAVAPAGIFGRAMDTMRMWFN